MPSGNFAQIVFVDRLFIKFGTHLKQVKPVGKMNSSLSMVSIAQDCVGAE